MRTRDTNDVIASLMAVAGDAVGVFAGFMVATAIRFETGWIPMFHDAMPPSLYEHYSYAAGIATLLFLFIFRSLGLYVRPQAGSFGNKVPRIVHATGLGFILSLALAFAIRTDPPFSRLTIMLAVPSILATVLIERYILFQVELHMARHRSTVNRVLIAGTGFVAARLRDALTREPRLRTRVTGFLTTRTGASLHDGIPDELLKGSIDDLSALLANNEVDQVILTDTGIEHDRIIQLLIQCERNLVDFKMVPDLLYVLTGTVDMQTVDDIPLLGINRWPLDSFWWRLVKRTEDMIGSAFGLVLLSPLFLCVSFLIRRSSIGPVFYVQERCGEHGKPFLLYKFRTMRHDAEESTGPVWATKNDPRRTRLGTFLRRWNIDELPQLWNVLKGEMSLVGPRPERPHFVEQFKEDISKYMWRHVSKPGMTGWAQVNGLRGNTDIGERIKYDLYYLENWSPAFDFKILVKTLFARENAY